MATKKKIELVRFQTDQLAKAINACMDKFVKDNTKECGCTVDSIEAHNAEEGVGTEATGYALPEMGPFRCDNCLHYKAVGEMGLCDHPEVEADPDVPKEDGKASVHPDACCNEFHPIDEGDDDEADDDN